MNTSPGLSASNDLPPFNPSKMIFDPSKFEFDMPASEYVSRQNFVKKASFYTTSSVGKRETQEPFVRYILSVRGKIEEIYKATWKKFGEEFMSDWDIRSAYQEHIGPEQNNMFEDFVLDLVLPEKTYNDNDIYTAMYHALNSFEQVSFLNGEFTMGKVEIVTDGSSAAIEKMSHLGELKESLGFLLDYLFDNFDYEEDEEETGIKDAPQIIDVEQGKKVLHYLAKFVEDMLFQYTQFLMAIFKEIEGEELDDEVTSQDIQELWKKKYESL